MEYFTKLTVGLIFGCCFTLMPANAAIIPLDLNDFYADPTVVVSGDGRSAVFSEDPFFSFVLLSNDPGLGDPFIITPAQGLSLLFNFSFTLGSQDVDQFSAYLTGSDGLSLGPSYEFATNQTSTGSISFDLSDLVGEVLGLTFQLSALPGDSGFNSLLEISSLQLVEAQAVSEPPTFALIAFTLFLMLRSKRKS